MRVGEARDLVIDLMERELLHHPGLVDFDPRPPGRDTGKFMLAGKPARVIHHFSGWFLPINREWFAGSFDPPKIRGETFFWYVFAIMRRGSMKRDHYFICDYLQMRDWVLGFDAPLGNDHRDHGTWRSDLRVYPEDPDERTGYFRWGDEPVQSVPLPDRVIALDNLATLSELTVSEQRIGVFGTGGEQAAHRLLKLYVANNGAQFGLSDNAIALIEHRFRTGDRVDVMFQNHEPERTVVEIEVAGEQNICTGIHQAIKYRSLAEVEGGFVPRASTVRSAVIAYDVEYEPARQLADRYEVDLIGVDPKLVLAGSL